MPCYGIIFGFRALVYDGAVNTRDAYDLLLIRRWR